jgi:hypothetical protein
MPTCDCGRVIQSGQQCQQCTLDDLYGDAAAGDADESTGGGIAYLGSTEVDQHYCDICERVCQTLDELATHECRTQLALPGDADDPDPHPRRPMITAGNGLVMSVRGPDPDAYQAWEQARDDGGVD